MDSIAGTAQRLSAEQVSAKKKSRGARRLSKVFAILLVIWLAACGALFATMRQPPETFARVMSHLGTPAFLVFPFETLWIHARAGQLQPGDLAPDFSLLKLDKTASIQLSALSSQKPVVLVFGSYT